MKVVGKQGPTVSWRRWGVFCVAVIALPLLVGCGGSRLDMCGKPLSMRYAAPADSLGLAEFLALPVVDREWRRSQAQHYAREARGASRVDLRVGKLTTAAGLAPDDPEYWLTLAKLWRGLGDYLQTDACLENATSAVGQLDAESAVLVAHGPSYRESAALDVALQRAWLHYDRAEWNRAQPWVRAALRTEPGNEAAWQIGGLLAGVLGRQGRAQAIADDLRRKDGFSTDMAWIMAKLDESRGNDREAFNYFLDLRPDERRVAECYRDMGRSAERVGEWSYAGRWYRESAAALPFRDITCLTERQHTRISGTGDGPRLPFWLARGTSYVTGSISAYLAYAFEQFESVGTAAARDLWGGLVVDAAGTCLRLDLETPAARRIRGLVFARTEHPDRALRDLRVALAATDQMSGQSAQLEAEIGHLLLLEKQSAEAAGHLRRALMVEPDGAQVWSDLGLALIMAGDSEAADEALTRAISLDPQLAAAWYNRGLLHLHAGDLVQAETDLGRAAALAPDNMDIANLLQQVRRQRQQFEQP